MFILFFNKIATYLQKHHFTLTLISDFEYSLTSWSSNLNHLSNFGFLQQAVSKKEISPLYVKLNK